MTTYAKTARARANTGNPYVATQTFDAALRNLAQNDIAELINVPAGSVVHWVRWEVQTVEGAARNFALGDGSSTSGFIATTSANSVANGCSALALTEGTPNTVTGYSAGKYYGSADTIDLLAVTSGGLTAAKIRVSALITRLAD
jgi:hypothetical protein